MKNNYFVKLNVNSIPIETVQDEHNKDNDFMPSFWWNNKRYYLNDFIRIRNNAWISEMDCPEYIHGFEIENYVNPLYIEINDDYINLYEQKDVIHGFNCALIYKEYNEALNKKEIMWLMDAIKDDTFIITSIQLPNNNILYGLIARRLFAYKEYIIKSFCSKIKQEFSSIIDDDKTWNKIINIDGVNIIIGYPEG